MNSEKELKSKRNAENIFQNGEDIDSVQCKVTGKIGNYF